jgi:2-polyprenyl-6-methoxyphenol hydroxylase-like FAD-dependent oxidoreductase
VLETGIFGLGPGKSGPECNNSAVTNASKDSIDYRDAFDMPTQVYNEHFIRAIHSSPIQRERQPIKRLTSLDPTELLIASNERSKQNITPTSFEPTMGLKIAIVGAGPAGCLLARLLKHQANNDTDIDITIFESEKSIDYRSQGGTLDLRAKTGQRALREAGLYDEFLKHARFDGEALSIADKDFVRYLTVKGNQNANSVTSGRPEIDRPVLRRILYESLPEGTVCWNHKLDHIEEPGTLHFTNQPPRSGFDLIVGADGAWSRVRNHLSATKPYYSGISGHAFSIPNAAQSTPDLFAQTNRGSLFAWSDNKSIMAQCMGDGSLSIYTWSRRPATWRKDCGYDVHDAKAVKEACLRNYADWDPRLVAYTQRAEDDVVPRDLYMLPVGFEWEHVRGVTLVGDAAHLMVSQTSRSSWSRSSSC